MQINYKSSMQVVSFLFLLGLFCTFIKISDAESNFLSSLDLINFWSCMGTISALIITIGSLNESINERKRSDALKILNEYYKDSDNLFGQIYNAVPTSDIKQIMYGSIAIKTAISDLNYKRIKELRENFSFDELNNFLKSYENFIRELYNNRDILGSGFGKYKILTEFRHKQIIEHLSVFLAELIKFDMGKNKECIHECIEIVGVIIELSEVENHEKV